MNIDKEIDKLAKDLCAKYSPNCRECPDCVAKDDAKTLIDKGWRKASDVAREIFERLHSHRKFDGHTVSVWLNDLVCIAKEYGIDLEGDAELKKRYTEEKQ